MLSSRPRGDALVRTPNRNFAERERGFALVSASLASIG
jgi:hypothetical protein